MAVSYGSLATLRNTFYHYIRQNKTSVAHSPKAIRLAATCFFVLSIVASGYGTRNWLRRQERQKAAGRRLLRRNSGLRGKDGSRIIIVSNHDSTSRVVIYPIKETTFDAHRRLFLNPPRAARIAGKQSVPNTPPPQTKPGLNLAFLHQFLSLMSIMIPHWNSKESGLLFSQGAFLMLRTYLSLVVARLDGELVRDLVAGNGKAFMWGIFKWCGIGGIASYTNAAIKYLQSKVSIAFRTRMTRGIRVLSFTCLNMNMSSVRPRNANSAKSRDLLSKWQDYM